MPENFKYREKPNVIVRQMKAEDAGSVFQIAEESRLAFWSQSDYENETRLDESIAVIAEFEREPVGFLIARLIILQTTEHFLMTKTDKKQKQTVEVVICNIAVKSEFQKSGIGGELLKFMRGCIRTNKIIKQIKSVVTVWLEVRAANHRAINFYSANNFRTVSVRKKFYANPVEDALLMKLEYEL